MSVWEGPVERAGLEHRGPLAHWGVWEGPVNSRTCRTRAGFQRSPGGPGKALLLGRARLNHWHVFHAAHPPVSA